ncbi:MAG TPA: 4-(cytidine 5'-diphospho)-2-C-methyl-D-erythritol kinase [Desulfobacteraceae bacterium]|nr:4-(cytidine 5'-diphospho)-2-C-methyl-D-erythritol kinase [Desulfobacteraceae bacterium]
MSLPQDRVSRPAPAKVNLYLKVTGRRKDGYHYLFTLMQKITLFDRVDLERIPMGIQLRCPDSDLPPDETNLAFRAARIFLERMKNRVKEGGTGVAITLRKSIPVAAGLGGGSSDAAAVLRGLDELFATACRESELHDMGALLGADVPFFVDERPVAWATGIGENLHPAVPLSGYRILVVNPGYSVSTRWVYEKFALTVGQNINNLRNFDIPEADGGALAGFSRRAIRPDEMCNDLEQVTSSHYREIDQLKRRLVNSGAVAAMMSGSGPTVFGLFQASEAERAATCAQELQREYQGIFLVDPLQA